MSSLPVNGCDATRRGEESTRQASRLVGDSRGVTLREVAPPLCVPTSSECLAEMTSKADLRSEP